MHDYKAYRVYSDGRSPLFLGVVKASDQGRAVKVAVATYGQLPGTRIEAVVWSKEEQQRIDDTYAKLRKLAGG